MFGIKNNYIDIFGVIGLIGVITYSLYNKGLESFASGEFWVLFFVLVVQIKHIIPEKLKSKYFYLYNKNISGKYFNFNLSYSFIFKNEKITPNEIFIILESLLINEKKTFRKEDNNIFLFGDYLKIKYSFDTETKKQQLCFNVKNDKYTIDSLEKDLDYYKRIFGIIKDNLGGATEQSISSNIKVNKFYTPDYLLKKYSKGYNNLEVKIDNLITLIRKIEEEELSISSSVNIDDITNKLKQYINLTL